ncbi:hypothetical protein ABS71_12875 [bacterium SCN 62-11]|nr:hypothetical protein [Candidatus Eremiobacteraeota bacterium]ODT64698.1 MAG: hypothetical protein ABS71_12875 [bacterium SCN 62-11]
MRVAAEQLAEMEGVAAPVVGGVELEGGGELAQVAATMMELASGDGSGEVREESPTGEQDGGDCQEGLDPGFGVHARSTQEVQVRFSGGFCLGRVADCPGLVADGDLPGGR